METCNRFCPNAEDCALLAGVRNQSLDRHTGKLPAKQVWREYKERTLRVLDGAHCAREDDVKNELDRVADQL